MKPINLYETYNKNSNEFVYAPYIIIEANPMYIGREWKMFFLRKERKEKLDYIKKIK